MTGIAGENDISWLKYKKGGLKCLDKGRTKTFASCFFFLAVIITINWYFNGGINQTVHEILPKANNKIQYFNQRNKPGRQSNHVLCLTYLGRLGNNMFQFAAGFAIAKQKNMHFIIRENNPLIKIFNISPLPLSALGLPQNHCSRISPIADRWHSSYDPAVTNVSNHHDVHLKGYFQSWKYWINYEEELRQIFTFRPDIMSKVKQRLQRVPYIFEKDTVSVGIHVRRGDYIAGWKVGKTEATAQYFRHALQYFRSKFKKVVFVVVSDDFKWCKLTFKNESNLYFMEGNRPAVDMAILSVTNHTITSVGTFSYWGAWLANGTNIFFNKLFTPGSGNAKNFRNDTYNYVYPGWIPMS